jgi:hypothetical protein
MHGIDLKNLSIESLAALRDDVDDEAMESFVDDTFGGKIRNSKRRVTATSSPKSTVHCSIKHMSSLMPYGPSEIYRAWHHLPDRKGRQELS